jgi:hypothetical protein
MSLDHFLNRLRRMGRPDGRPWNITGVEVRGFCAKVRWDADGNCVGYTAGSLMKLPQTFLDSPEREEELRSTAKFTLTQLGALHRKPLRDYLSDSPNDSKGGTTDPSISCPPAGLGCRSTKTHPIKRREVERIGSEYANAAHRLYPSILLTEGKSRHVVTREDQAIYLCILAFCTSTQSEDKAMPSRRIFAIWKAMFDAKDVSRAPDHGRLAALRNHLSDSGKLDWYSNDFWCPDKPTFQGKGIEKGVCCKYSIKKQLMLELGFTSADTQRETATRTRIETTQYPDILSFHYPQEDRAIEGIRPQRIGWASQYWGLAA